MRGFSLCLGVLLLAGSNCEAAPKPASPASAPLIESYLIQGKLADGEKALLEALEKMPEDDQARFSLGMVRFLRGIERFAQTQYRHGLLQHRLQFVPFVRSIVPENAEPERLTYADTRQMLSTLNGDLQQAEATLAQVQSADVRLPLHFGRIRLDLNNDGKAEDSETLWRMFAVLNRSRQLTEETAQQFQITFDAGDVHWLRGYCHLLMTLTDVSLAYDSHDLFERTAHLFYPSVETPYAFLAEQSAADRRVGGLEYNNIVDVIAMIHLMNFPVHDAEHMQSALAHMQAMIEQSRASWNLILAETDDDHEWLPNPEQTGVIPNVRVRPEMIDGWRAFLDEGEAILDGKKLLPFWRGEKKLGVNLRRVFTEPQRFDLVIWIQGTGANPYLEEGTMTDPVVWQRLMRVFRGEFLGFAIWFN